MSGEIHANCLEKIRTLVAERIHDVDCFQNKAPNVIALELSLSHKINRFGSSANGVQTVREELI
jgi:hypothetical protein